MYMVGIDRYDSDAVLFKSPRNLCQVSVQHLFVVLNVFVARSKQSAKPVGKNVVINIILS